jgi:hypothetical protein
LAQEKRLLTVNKQVFLISILVILSSLVIAFLVHRQDALPVLGAVMLLGALTLMFVWPEIATLLVAFVLYSNLAAVAIRYHAVPTFLAGAVGLPLAIPLANYLILRRERLRIDRVFALMLVFLLVLIASSFFAKDMGMAEKRIGTFVLEGLVLYLLIINVIRSLTTLRRVVWTVILVGSLLGAMSFYQALTHSYGQQFGGLAYRDLKFEIAKGTTTDETGTGTLAKARLADRAQGPLGDPNYYAQIMLIVLPLALFRFWNESSRWLRAFAAVASGFILCGVLLSYSRGAFLTLVLLIFILMFMRYVRPFQVVVFVLFLVILIALFVPNYQQRMETILGGKGLFFKDAAVRPDYVTRSRATEMRAAFAVFADHPLLGVGPGQYAPFYSVSYQLKPEVAVVHIPKTRRAHNLYLEMAAETGLIGLTIFMSIILVVLYGLLRARRGWAHRRPDLCNIATALGLSIIAYLGTSVFLQLAYERYHWFLLAVAGAALHIFRSEEHIERQKLEA